MSQRVLRHGSWFRNWNKLPLPDNLNVIRSTSSVSLLYDFKQALFAYYNIDESAGATAQAIAHPNTSYNLSDANWPYFGYTASGPGNSVGARGSDATFGQQLQYGAYDSSFSIIQSNWSIGFWIKPLSIEADDRGILGKADAGSGLETWRITLGPSSTLKLDIKIEDGGITNVITSTLTGMSINNWYFIVVTRNNTSFKVLFHDGSNINTYSTDFNLSVVDQNNIFQIGRASIGGTWKGQPMHIARFFLSYYTISNNEFLALYNSGNGLKYSEL